MRIRRGGRCDSGARPDGDESERMTSDTAQATTGHGRVGGGASAVAMAVAERGPHMYALHGDTPRPPLAPTARLPTDRRERELIVSDVIMSDTRHHQSAFCASVRVRALCAVHHRHLS